MLASSKEKEPIPEVAHVSLAEAIAKGPPPAGNLAVPIFGRGSLQVEMYRPEGSDPQKPHDRDEVYLVVRGKRRLRRDKATWRRTGLLRFRRH